ncbi:hypothetical protein DYBT9275_02729 [Dyadobacter sp. CECT 9275]|uniref:Uncharacterized protein n=1 Tax=Dyadobacter helix TaxID=2822344 RepID=A0A916JBD4_9BACT|nr:hypothetical protein [Dyadobacter sp. CECT 9275]CAG5001724.1 hypothetical protein DYBT9275_02729 [Dyadobacter sp. CECT 9275]
MKTEQELIDLIISYEAACELRGVTPLTIEDFAKHPEEDRDSDFASHQLNVICSAFWNGEKIDYTNFRQKKYEIIWVWNENTAGGSGFSFGGVLCLASASFVGARHSYPSDRIARIGATRFVDIYNRFLSPYKPK